uniref:Plastid division protein PDV1 n=1 Tax=Zea mays TaxID=4577 RepID=B6T501_MAIZE|nr:hypothetical protein [Zea mays]|eukprot:NP_001143451.1 uncharacterized protein LOC100276107 [Zea mays]
MGPEQEEAVLETIWDLHDKVSDAIHALSRAHFLRAVRRRSSASAPGLVDVKGGGLGLGARGGDEVVALAALAEEARSLHAIRAALEDLEDQFECFLAVQTQQQAERDFAMARLEQSRIMLAIRLKEHHGRNHKVIDEASAFVRDVYQDVWPSLSATKAERRADSSGNPAKGPSFLARMVSSSLTVAGSGFSLKSLALALGLVAVLQSSGVGDRRYRRTTSERSSSWLGSSSPRGGRTGRLDVSLARG